MKQIVCADAVQWANEYEGDLFHALFCDSPYHLQSIVKRYSKPDAKTENSIKKYGTQGVSPYMRGAKGFMGQQWDGGDVAFRPETWAAFMRVLHPGAFGMTFAGSRGWHRLAVAIEDAGFIIHPSIFGWAYGSGFPKATRIKGDERFNGHRYGLQALKPALEPIIVFQKPYEGRPIDNIQETGAGVLNIESGRIGTESIPSNQWSDSAHPFGNGAGNDYETVMNSGRWPSNFILLDEQAAAALDRQSGHLVSGKMLPEHKRHTDESPHGIYGKFDLAHPLQETIGDEGGAARFFFQVQEQIDSADPVYYEAKAGGEERNAGLREFKLQLTPKLDGGPFVSPTGNDSTKVMSRNPHPTVKPLSLTRYLASLLLPPAEYSPRRLFVPFAGVASEMIGAMQAGWDEIVGVEITESYILIAQARMEYWRNQGWQTTLFSVENGDVK